MFAISCKGNGVHPLGTLNRWTRRSSQLRETVHIFSAGRLSGASNCPPDDGPLGWPVAFFGLCGECIRKWKYIDRTFQLQWIVLSTGALYGLQISRSSWGPRAIEPLKSLYLQQVTGWHFLKRTCRILRGLCNHQQEITKLIGRFKQRKP